MPENTENTIKKRKPMSAETKKKIGDKKRGKPFSGKWFSHLGVKVSEETKNKMSAASKGKKKTAKHAQNISNGKKGKGFSGSHRLNLCLSHGGKIENFDNPKYKSWRKNKRNRAKRAAIKNLGTHTYGDWENLKKQYGYTCPCCGESEPEISLTQDHIIPLSKGGSDLIENIQPLCLRCNLKKHTLIIKY